MSSSLTFSATSTLPILLISSNMHAIWSFTPKSPQLPASPTKVAVDSQLHVSSSVEAILAGLGGTGTSTSSKDNTVVPLVPALQEQVETPLDTWLAEIFAGSSLQKRQDMVRERRPRSSLVPSGQMQIPVADRIKKALHEESLPWLITAALPIIASLSIQNPLPATVAFVGEFGFLLYCSLKVLFLFNTPTTPQPFSREWITYRDLVWNSHPDVDSKRNFLMGWFFDEDFSRLRREDALIFLAWKRYGVPIEHLSKEEVDELQTDDLVKLEDMVNSGMPLPARGEGEAPLGCMRFNCEPLRYRHKPLIFYWITHGAFHYLDHTLQNEHGFQYTPAATDSGSDISYWYRAPSCPASEANPPLVFVHGVGGLSFYYPLLSSIIEEATKSGDNTPIIFLDLPQVSLRINDNIPSAQNSVASIKSILDKTCGTNSKATFVGHSFGSILLSWMVQGAPERVSNCVFLDPVCFQLHQKDVLFNFHMKRADQRFQNEWENPLSLGALVNLAGTEMHTNNSMLRNFCWQSNALWPQDLFEQDISACVLLSEKDEIVPSSDVAALFDAFNDDKKSGVSALDEIRKHLTFFNLGDNQSPTPFVKSQILKDASHGDFIFDDDQREEVVGTISAMHRLNTIKQTQQKKSELFQATFPGDNLGIDLGELWEQAPFVLN